MLYLVYLWVTADAEWWQFWLPQSGFRGGCVLGAIMNVVAAVWRWLS